MMNAVFSLSFVCINEGIDEGTPTGAIEGTPTGAKEGPSKDMGLKTTPFEIAFWVDDELSAIEADIKNALKSPFETEFTKLETSESYRDCGDLPLVGTFNCVVASIS
jgi:hypothetical protein